jgi:DHA2 family multidrug resistance protein
VTPRPPVNKWLVTVSVTFGTLMGAIDASIVNVALPHIRGAVNATVEEITWITTGFVIATVIVMPLTAFLGRMFGQKRVYMLCLVIFIAGSALCGTARTLPALVAFRVIQGIGAGALQPTEQAILRQTFSLKEQGMAMAVFAMAVMLGPALGPTLGGYIVDHYSWPWIFYINLPVGALGLLMVSQFVHEDPEVLESNRALAARQRSNVDWAGIGLLSVGLASLQYFLEEGQKNDWFQSYLILGCFAVAVTSLAAFVIRELTAAVPAVNLRLFKDPVFTSGTLVGSVMFAMLLGNMFLLPIFMQELLGFTATQSGWALMPRVLVMMVATPLVGRIYNLVSPRLVIAFGVICFSIGAYQMSHFTLETSQLDIIKSILIQGVGFACLFVPLTTVALSTIPKAKMPDATGLNSLLRQIGGSIGLAGFATLLTRYAVDARASISAHVVAERPEIWDRLQMIQRGIQGLGRDAVTSHAMAIGALFGDVARQGMAMAFDKIFLLAGILFLLVLPLLLFLKAPNLDAPKAEVHLDM